MLAALLALATLSVAAVPPQDPKALIAMGRFAEAQALLDSQVAAGSSRPETYFLLGLVALHAQDYRKAITRFRRALILDPRSARLRLELGRAFYLANDYSNAELQFQRALAGDLPTPVKANARRFLDRIRREKRWSYEFSLGLAPSTNINAGSAASEAVIFGLPFQLGNDARMRSGVGFVADASAEFAPRVSDRLRWKTGIAVRRSEYAGSHFDEMIASGWSGPQWFGKDVEISAAATSLWRWYGGGVYQRAIGIRLEAGIYAGPRTALLLATSAQKYRYPGFDAQSGPVWSVSGAVSRIFDPTTSVALIVSGSLQNARTRDLTNRSGFVSVTASHDFSGGFTLTAAPTYAVADYEAPDAFFGIRRRDRSKELRVTLLNRRAAIWRFTPTFTYTRLRRHSTIGLYDSHQDRLDLGLTSTF